MKREHTDRRYEGELRTLREQLLLMGARVEEMIEALHRFLTLTPSRLLCVALTDLVGDRQAQNQPGTTDEYPNWRVPLTGPTGEPLSLEDVLASPRAAGLAALAAGVTAGCTVSLDPASTRPLSGYGVDRWLADTAAAAAQA